MKIFGYIRSDQFKLPFTRKDINKGIESLKKEIKYLSVNES